MGHCVTLIKNSRAKMAKSKVSAKAFDFARNVLGLVLKLPKDETRFVLGKQLLRAGTSVGANIEEALGGLSKRDFTHSMNIAKKEARESKYWLKLLRSVFDEEMTEKVDVLIKDANELIKILTAIVQTSQNSGVNKCRKATP